MLRKAYMNDRPERVRQTRLRNDIEIINDCVDYVFDEYATSRYNSSFGSYFYEHEFACAMKCYGR